MSIGNEDTNPEQSPTLKDKFQQAYKRFKALQGDPHYIAVGMGIGVFVAVTPTIPFHTALALALAFILKGSKPAAAIGVWFSNPITIPPFYWSSYKVGCLFLGKTSEIDLSNPSIQTFMKTSIDVTIASVFGGAILGIIPGIVAYFITLRIFTAIRSKRKKSETA